ncbi:putative HTH-type transcriptional regulator YusO [Poriferisphaera corsica]|uniref:Putative HTH-type transcriptional regulator YusO n=1 Tax=Poriferisphaera corsica TaxID=2528020 RepID=A0A517YP68_9BACT|nr:MarR family transcriptional regulator [Poriferisphaera corsica]QDU32018.1 putative HTH-type transcriptional regulator YusO [Poriferisphaera corsica]
MEQRLKEIIDVSEELGDCLVFNAISRVDRAGKDALSGLTGRQIHVVVGLSKIEPCSLKAAAKRMGVSDASASVMVDTLVGKGMLRRVRDEHDRRKVLISLTDEVRQSMEEIDEEIWATYVRFTKKLDDDVLDRWHAVMGELKEVLDECRDEFE